MVAPDMLAEILRLPAIDGESEADVASAWDAEIERRGAEVDLGTAETMTLEEYQAHIQRRRAARAGR